MKNVLQLENELSFQEFTHEDGLKIGLQMIERVKKEKLKRIGVRVVLNDLLVFQYLMDGKKEDVWLKRKQKTVEDSGHSSYYVFLENEQNQTYQKWVENDNYAVCGGGFPINVEGKMVGSICVSGLPHEQDHQLIIDGLTKYIMGEM